jgi:hypothetical protein
MRGASYKYNEHPDQTNMKLISEPPSFARIFMLVNIGE